MNVFDHSGAMASFHAIPQVLKDLKGDSAKDAFVDAWRNTKCASAIDACFFGVKDRHCFTDMVTIATKGLTFL